MTDSVALIVNLGSPDSPTPADVGRYLDEFLMDPRVIDVPWVLRAFIVKGLIVPKRSKASAEAYQEVWSDAGSPLVAISSELRERVQENCSVPVVLAMRYGNPSIASAIERIHSEHPHATKLRLIPLYPHYAMSTFESVVEEVKDQLAAQNHEMDLHIQTPFFNDPEYIEAFYEVSKPAFDPSIEHVVFSYHGLPERHLKKTDPTRSHCMSEGCCDRPSPAHSVCYRAQSMRTTEALIERACIDPSRTSVAFQSRLGRDKWLDPNTEDVIRDLAKQGKRKIAVLCPSFVSDCLETIEEIGIRAKDEFREAGGDELVLAPCLNTHPNWVALLTKWCSA